MNLTKKFRIAQALFLCAAFLSSMAAAFFGFLYFSFYWPYRGLFNEAGRYFDEQSLTVYHEEDGIYIIPMLVFLILALVFISGWWMRRRSVANRPGA